MVMGGVAAGAAAAGAADTLHAENVARWNAAANARSAWTPETAKGLEPAFESAIQALIAASHGSLYIVSGYRSVAEQQQLWDAAVKKYGSPEAAQKWVAPPGHSNHNRGLAVDLGGDIQLAHQLAAQFGLVFPMSWEPWHIEPLHARESSSPQAYTTPPPGQQNPVHDQSLSTRPEYLAASLADAMSAASMGAMGAGLGLANGEIAPLGGGAAKNTGGGGSGGGAGGFGPAGSQKGGAGSVSPAALYKALRAQGLDPVHAAAFVAVAGRESGYQTGAHNPDRSTGDNSYGLFQVNLLNGMHSQYSPEMLGTLEGSAQAAAEMFKSGGTNPWGPYKGVSWLANTNGFWQTAADASGGEVTAEQIGALVNEGLK